MDSLNKLEEMINSFPPDYILVKKAMISQLNIAKIEFEDYQNRSITWGVDDFEMRAEEVHGKDWEKYFDKELFQEELEDMIHQHDATIGINWDTVDVYLDNCKRK